MPAAACRLFIGILPKAIRIRFHLITLGDVVSEYEYHPEAKCVDAKRNASGKQTIGLLQRRHICIDEIKYVARNRTAWKRLKLA